MKYLKRRTVLGMAFLTAGVLVYLFLHLDPMSDLRAVKPLLIFFCAGQAIVFIFKLNKSTTDALDYIYYAAIGVGISIVVTMNADKLNHVYLEIATDRTNKSGDLIIERCRAVDTIKESKQIGLIRELCEKLPTTLTITNFWVSMTGTEEDVVTKTDFEASLDDFQNGWLRFGFLIDLSNDYISMAQEEKESSAKAILLAASELRENINERISRQSKILGAKRIFSSELIRWYLENWIYVLSFIISLKMMKTTNALFPGATGNA